MLFWYCPPLWRRDVKGLENINHDKPCVIVINHNHMLDIFALYFLPLIFRWVSKKEVFKIPLVGAYLWMHGDIAIDRKYGTQAMKKVLQDGQEWLKKGVCIAMFPEGTRSKDGEIHRFKAGAFALADSAEVDILPVVIQGTRDVFRHDKKYLFNWKLNLKIRVLPRLSYEHLHKMGIQSASEKVHDEMVATLQQLQKES